MTRVILSLIAVLALSGCMKDVMAGLSAGTASSMVICNEPIADVLRVEADLCFSACKTQICMQTCLYDAAEKYYPLSKEKRP